MMWLFLFMLIAQAPTLQRLPLQKNRLSFDSPVDYAKRVLRYDRKTGEPIYYDPKPQVTLLDAKAGKYAFKWIGYDGKKKVVLFQRHDAVDAVVSASVSKTASGQYLYAYKIENLMSSGQNLSGFVIQAFGADAKAVELDNIYVGQMSKSIRDFSEGSWIDFSFSSKFRLTIGPGKNVEVKLISSAPPGLVECRIYGGGFGLKGVGEGMPQELENLLPRYDDWPKGYTIGPVDNLKSLSATERANYLLKLLPQFQRLGWITNDALSWDEQNLMRGNFEVISKRADEDFKARKITSEVNNMIQALKQ